MFGILNDRVPIMGYQRKAYIALGWSFCTLSLVVLALQDMPLQGDANASGFFTMWMALAALGYIVADVAADGLTAELGKLELPETRGTIQSNVYLARAVGAIAASLLVGLGMNGKEYNGTFDRTLTFTQVCAVLACISVLMIPVSLCSIEESCKTASPDYFSKCYKLLQNKGMFYLMMYCLFHSAIGDISTTAGGHVMQTWAQVHNLQSQMTGILGHGIFIIGLCIVKRFMLHQNWRHIIIVTTVLLTAVDAAFTYCTIYDVVRNQYFYLGETVVVLSLIHI